MITKRKGFLFYLVVLTLLVDDYRTTGQRNRFFIALSSRARGEL